MNRRLTFAGDPSLQACSSLIDDHDEDGQVTPIPILDHPLRPVDQQTSTPSDQQDNLQRLLQQVRNIPPAVTNELLSCLRDRSYEES